MAEKRTPWRTFKLCPISLPQSAELLPWQPTHTQLELQTINRFSQSWRRPPLGPSPGWKGLRALSHLISRITSSSLVQSGCIQQYSGPVLVSSCWLIHTTLCNCFCSISASFINTWEEYILFCTIQPSPTGPPGPLMPLMLCVFQRMQLSWEEKWKKTLIPLLNKDNFLK